MIDKTIKQLSTWFFVESGVLALFTLLLILVLRWHFRSGLGLDRKAYKSEILTISWVFSIFIVTYALRGLSDRYLLPHMLEARGAIGSNLVDGRLIINVKSSIVVYYMLSSLVFDFLPLLVMFLYHGKNFEPQQEEPRYKRISVESFDASSPECGPIRRNRLSLNS